MSKPWRRTANRLGLEPIFAPVTLTYNTVSKELTVLLSAGIAQSTVANSSFVCIAVDANRRQSSGTGTVDGDTITFPTLLTGGGNGGTPRTNYQPSSGSIRSVQGHDLPTFLAFTTIVI